MAKQKDKKAQPAKKTAPSRKQPAAPASAKKVAVTAQRKPAVRKAKSDNNKAPAPIARPGEITMPAPDAEMPKTYLSTAELEEFKQILLIKRAQLKGDIHTLNQLHKNRQESSGDLSSVPFHPADAGSDTFEQDFTIGLMDNEQGMLRDINDALDRISDGTYGICVATHKPISKARLQATPWAKHCIEYARLLEKGQAPKYRH